jgi:hypothetical protein
MRLFLRLVLSAVGLANLVFAQQTVVVTSSAGAGGLGLYSDGTSWPTNGGFTFELGLFPAGFDPVSAERSSWIKAWVPVQAVASAEAVNTWFADGASTYFSLAASTAALLSPATLGTQYYVWGYNTKTTTAAAEWILLTNPAWKVVDSPTPLLPDQFDTKDAGTAALVGRLLNGGADLESSRVFANVLAISAMVSNFTVAVGQSATLSVSAIGSGLSYQWYVGNAGDTSNPVAGATKANFTVGTVATTNRYWVRISDGVRTVDSAVITVTAAGSGSAVNSVHSVASLGYIPGERVTIKNQIVYAGAVTELDVATLLPAGWTYIGGDLSGAQYRPSIGQADELGWKWTTVPPSPFTFTFTVAVPAGISGEQVLRSIVTAMKDGVAYQGLSSSDPLLVRAGPLHHSADTNRNNMIDLLELTRVVQLYNTRSGTVRTGGYRVDPANTEDGFDPDATGPGAAGLASYHTADNSPRDGRINLEELTRVIELFNARAGSARTGAYRARGDTQDGFISVTSP